MRRSVWQTVGNSALLLASFTSFVEDYDIESTKQLLVEWKAPANTDEKGRKGMLVRDGEALGYGYYPADKKIDFSIPNPDSTGIYYLEIGTTGMTGANERRLERDSGSSTCVTCPWRITNWAEFGGFKVLIRLPGCATSSSYSFM